MPESRFAVGERVFLTEWSQIFLIKEIKFIGEQCYITAISQNMNWVNEVELYEERFEKIINE